MGCSLAASQTGFNPSASPHYTLSLIQDGSVRLMCSILPMQPLGGEMETPPPHPRAGNIHPTCYIAGQAS
jgi:hypothetical protein